MMADIYNKSASLIASADAISEEKIQELVAQKTFASLVDFLRFMIEGSRRAAEIRLDILSDDIFYVGAAYNNPAFIQDREKHMDAMVNSFFVNGENGIAAVLPQINDFSREYCAMGFMGIYDEPIDGFSDNFNKLIKMQEDIIDEYVVNPNGFNRIGKKSFYKIE